MEVILQHDVDALGFEGDVIKVANGYARNYLIPKGFAVESSIQNKKAFELKKKKIELKRLKAKEDAGKLKSDLESFSIVFSHKAGDEGKLYGSVTSMEIAADLESRGYVIDRKKIVLDKPIKNLGNFKVPVKVYQGVTAQLNVSVVSETEKQES